MNRDNAVEVEDLSKRYLLGASRPGGTLREALTHRVRALGGHRPEREEIWSLRDVSFTLREGHALGVIGRNGAGKSTLLKVLSRITEPTSGVSRTLGRVAALLEVGTGFHGELTGRENVQLNGAILGMTRRDLARRFDDIVEFSGVERFLDTPVKRYSSGMELRLAFAVAAHLEPDVLVVDEVLAVGDAEFQSKCLRRMSEVEREGRTVVFVSHDLDAIARLCPEGLWLDRGEVRDRGSSSLVIDNYLSEALHRDAATMGLPDRGGPVALRRVRITTPTGQDVSVLRRDQPFEIVLEVDVREALPGLDISFNVENYRGVRVLDEAWSDTAADRFGRPGIYVLRVPIPPILNVGEYRVGVWVGSAYDTILEESVVATFELEGNARNRPQRAIGLDLPWLLDGVAGASIDGRN